jgi:hypothetical protein
MGLTKQLIQIPPSRKSWEELYWESYSLNELEEIIDNKAQYLDSFIARAEAQLNTIKNQRHERYLQEIAS